MFFVKSGACVAVAVVMSFIAVTRPAGAQDFETKKNLLDVFSEMPVLPSEVRASARVGGGLAEAAELNRQLKAGETNPSRIGLNQLGGLAGKPLYWAGAGLIATGCAVSLGAGCGLAALGGAGLMYLGGKVSDRSGKWAEQSFMNAFAKSAANEEKARAAGYQTPSEMLGVPQDTVRVLRFANRMLSKAGIDGPALLSGRISAPRADASAVASLAPGTSIKVGGTESLWRAIDVSVVAQGGSARSSPASCDTKLLDGQEVLSLAREFGGGCRIVGQLPSASDKNARFTAICNAQGIENRNNVQITQLNDRQIRLKLGVSLGVNAAGRTFDTDIVYEKCEQGPSSAR